MKRPQSWNEHDDWDGDNYHVYYDPPDSVTVFEDYGHEWIDTGLVDSRGHPISRRNPGAKGKIGFKIPPRS